ncbi:MAG TPA: endopygalactorunase, partial [Niastella sp.]
MNAFKKNLLLLAACCMLQPVFAKSPSPNTTSIKPIAFATHIAAITKNTIVVVTGSTIQFTVDTPEDQGLRSTRPTVKQFLEQITSTDGSIQQYKIIDKTGNPKTEGVIEPNDRLVATSQNGKSTQTYLLTVKPMALSGRLQLQQQQITVNIKKDLTLFFTAGQRSPNATVKIYLPAGIKASMQNTTVNVIGRGDVTLAALAQQSIGRTGSLYSYSKVGEVAIMPLANGGSVLQFGKLDLRPANGADLKIVIHDVTLPRAGNYTFKATYTTAQPEALTSAGTGAETATLQAVQTITDLMRADANNYTQVHVTWSHIAARSITLMQSLDSGKSYQPAKAVIDAKTASATITALQPNKLYTFRLQVNDGQYKGMSNVIQHYSGKLDIKQFGVTGDSTQDYTQPINQAIEYLSRLGGGTLLFSKG